MRTIGLASVLFVAASLPKVSVSWSEPVWMVVWGSILIVASGQLRAAMTRTSVEGTDAARQQPQAARSGRKPARNVGLPLLGPVQPGEGSVF